MARADLLALSDDSLAALANRGIVKRSVREVAEGKGPQVSESSDGTVAGLFGDGTHVVLSPGATLEASSCTCPASGVCRHRVMVVVAYRSGAAAGSPPSAVDAPPPPAVVDWSPGRFDDDELEGLLGSRVLGLARKAHRAGYRARVRRPSSADPVPTVELASCTVRFLVPGELGYARVDAVRGFREDAVALAVWACRAADEVDAEGAVVDVAVGGGPAVASAAGAGGSGVEPALALLAELLADGVVHVGPAFGAALAQARRSLDQRNLRWPVDALDEVADQLEAYRARSARYEPAAVAALVAELVGRHRCVAGGGASLRPAVLGTEEAAETPLRLLRLTGLGARVWGDAGGRSLEVYLAHGEAGVVLTLRRRVEVAEGEPPAGAELARRKAGGAKLSALAGGNVVTESAIRAASRVVRLAESRVARTTIAPSAGRWDDLPAGILVGDLDAEAVRLAGLPPSVVRPRVAAEAVRAVAVEDVEAVGYFPGAQRVVATVRAPVGRATVSLAHSSAAPGAVDALAQALDGSLGTVRYVAGHLRRHAGEVVIEPSAVVAGTTVVVPGFAPAGAPAVAPGSAAGSEPLAAAVAEAIAVSAEVPHRGWQHLPAGWRGRAERAAAQLRKVGLERAAESLGALASAAGGPAGEAALTRWADAHLRLLVTTEQL